MKWRPKFLVMGWVLAAGGLIRAGTAERFELAWPTPNPAWAEGKPSSDFLQHAGSGDAESGAFGGVRSGGKQFHEGIDITCLARDRRGEPLDSVFAVMPGVVRHINSSAGDSSYGRYVVLEHPEQSPGVYTLYAHLARMAPGLREGAVVKRGEVIGVMGHSSGGYMIPVDRAHLHFEIGLMVARDFQSWYDRKRFGSHNNHGAWNGLNLMGVDPLDFFNAWRAQRISTVQEYFAGQKTAVRLRIASTRTPDFVTRYPALLTKPRPMGLVGGWEIRCNWTGVPFEWTPLTATEVAGLAPNRAQIIEADAALLGRHRSKSVAISRGGSWTVGKDLEVVLEQLFGLR